MPRIVVSAYAICFPVGGFLSWTLQWLVGLDRLGCDVYFVEKSGFWESPCVDLRTLMNSDDCSHGVSLFRDLLARHGLDTHFCFVDGRGEYHGMTRAAVEEAIRTADAFVDMGGTPFLDIEHTWMAEAATVPLRVLVDSEPGYTQMKMAHRLANGAVLHDFNRFFSVGLNLAAGTSTVPLLGHEWTGIVDPVVPDLFAPIPPDSSAPFTTVMNWESHASVTYDGVAYGQKDVEFEKFMRLPQLTPSKLEIAATGARLPHERLRANRWGVRDSFSVTSTFDAFCSYIANSRGEFAVAKNVFVATNSGFFSDRSAVYLVSGRPVIMQDTGFSAHLPCGEGLFAVKTAEDAAAAIAEVQADYPRHSAAARAIANDCLSSTVVLGKFLKDLGL